MRLLEVAVAAPVDQVLSYLLPTGEQKDGKNEGNIVCDDDLIGRRVLVPLGGRRLTGYVVAIREEKHKPDFKLRSITSFLDEISLIPPELLPFYRWVAGYYHYPLGLVLKATLPGGLTPKSVNRLVWNSPEKALPPSFDTGASTASWLTQLQDKGELSTAVTGELLKVAEQKKFVNRLCTEGLATLQKEIKTDSVRARIERCVEFVAPEARILCKEHNGKKKLQQEFNDSKQAELSCQLGLERVYGVKLKKSEVRTLMALSSLMDENDLSEVAISDLRKTYSSGSNALPGLEEKGLVRLFERRIHRSPLGRPLGNYPRPEQLTPQQEAVLEQILPAIGNRQFAPFLLHGVTGCGKTEVYLRSAERCLEEGRDVIFLVPEIALATQLEAQLLARFDEQVVLLHSGLTASERFDQYHLAISGKAKVVIGARSAVFAPLRNPGLIIVDEEHDAAFKQDDSFRYHGRDMAVMRAHHHGAVVILGSATPSVTSFANTVNGKYSLLSMPSRVGERSLPAVDVVDLSGRKGRQGSHANAQKKAGGGATLIHQTLQEKIGATLEKQEQVILLLNRRGFSAAVLCQDCGTPVQCTHCHVSLTLHKGDNRLVCHYCGFSQPGAGVCSTCRSTALRPVGFGTERVEEEISKLFPDARVKRLDSDTAADRRKFLSILGDMHDRQIDILIGTQMIAKGHHFPYVTLVGVVWADGGLSMPDFRAAERTYQLISQVTGRAGRGDLPGQVVIQTLRPDHYAIRFATQHSYENLYEQEMRLRRNPAFPPFVRLVVLRVEGKVERDVRDGCGRVAAFCRQFASGGGTAQYTDGEKAVEILGPAPAPIDKIKDKYRWQILIKGKRIEELHQLCSALNGKRRELLKTNCELFIDIDPENMM